VRPGLQLPVLLRQLHGSGSQHDCSVGARQESKSGSVAESANRRSDIEAEARTSQPPLVLDGFRSSGEDVPPNNLDEPEPRGWVNSITDSAPRGHRAAELSPWGN
jgi:hypothetical protein